MPGGWFTITVLIMLLVVAVVVAIRVAMRTMRTNRGGGPALFGTRRDECSATSRQSPNSLPPRVIGHRPSGIDSAPSHVSSRRLGVLNPVPGRTATELARDAGAAIPGFAANCAAPQ